MSESKVKLVSPPSPAPPPPPSPTEDEIAAAAFTAAGFDQEAISDFVFRGRPVEIDPERGFVKRMTGEATDAIDPQRPHIVDLWSCEEMFECWKPGPDGKNQKTQTIGPIRVVNGIKLPPHDTLPDRDPEYWPLSKKGRRYDPWRRRFLITFKDTVNGELLSWRYGFEGYDTIADVKATYVRNFHQHPGEMPVVLFGVRRTYSYDGTPRTNPALILTGQWLPFGERQSAPPISVTASTPTTLTVPKEAKPRKTFGEDEDVPF
jgi:hypothetical protein